MRSNNEQLLASKNIIKELHLEVEKVEEKYKHRINNLEKEKDSLLERNEFLEKKVAQMEELQRTAIAHARSQGVQELEYKTNQMKVLLEKMEKIHDYQGERIDRHLPKAIEIATRSNNFFGTVSTQTDLGLTSNQFVQSYFKLNQNLESQQILFNRLTCHPIEAFISKDMIGKRYIEGEKCDEIFEQFIFGSETVYNENPCYTLMDLLTSKLTKEETKLPRLSRNLTKLVLHYTRDSQDNKLKELFALLFGINGQRGLSNVEWANLCFFKKVVMVFFNKVSNRYIGDLGFKTTISKSELVEINKMISKIKKDLGIDSMITELSWWQVKSIVQADLFSNIRKSEVPSDHLIHLLSDKLEGHSYCEIMKKMISLFEEKDPDQYGFILFSDLTKLTNEDLRIPSHHFKKYHEIWFSPHIQFGFFFDYHQFMYDFVKDFFKDQIDPKFRNPEVYIVDILLMKVKFLKKVSWIEKERIKEFLRENLRVIDLDSLSLLIFCKPLKDCEEKQREEVFQAISAARSCFELKSNRESDYHLSLMPKEEANNLVNLLTEYFLSTNVGGVAERVLDKPNQNNYFKYA